MSPTVVALVPTFNSGVVVETVRALGAAPEIERVVVVDDGSTSVPVPVAELVDAGAIVAELPSNRGKGAAVAAGLALLEDADVVLLADADLGATAAELVALLPPVVDGTAEMAVAKFPPAGGRAGFGLVKGWSARAVERLGGVAVSEPLSGQRALRRDLLDACRLAPRFGLEVALGIDVARAGGRIVEVPLPLDHAHTGRSVAGFRHRGRQAVDIARSVLPRVGTPLLRRALCIALTVLVSAWVVLLPPGRSVPGRPVFAATGAPVVLVTVTGMRQSDLATGRYPNLARLLARSGGVLAARTPSSPSDLPTAFATLGAGAPVIMRPPEAASPTGPAENEGLQGAPVVDPVAPDVQLAPVAGGGGRVVTEDRPADDRRSTGTLGLLGAVLHRAGRTTGYVGARSGAPGAPAALAVADEHGTVDVVSPGSLPGVAAGASAAVAERVAAVRTTSARAAVTVVDAGTAPPPRPVDAPPLTDAEVDQREQQRLAGLEVADLLVGRVADEVRPASVVVAAVAPPGKWRLGPLTTVGGRSGALTSPSTKRAHEVVLTDLAPTVLAAVGLDVPSEMVGAAAEAGPGRSDPAALTDLDRRTDARERAYVPMIWVFVGLQGIIYLGSLVVLRRRTATRHSRVAAVGVPVVLGSVAFPAVTFVYRLAPAGLQQVGPAMVGIAVCCALVAWWSLHCRRTALSPLTAISGLTTAVLLVDAAWAGWLQHVSLLGYTPITAARFYGMGNMGFAILGAAALVLAGSWVDAAPDRTDGLVAAGCLLWTVALVEMLPAAGADFGSVIVFVPTFLLALAAWSGVRFTRLRLVLLLAGVAVVVAAAVVVDLKVSSGTHLGRFVDGGVGGAGDVVLRKLETNLRVMRITTWTWMVPIILVFILGTFVARGGSDRWFGENRTWRVTFLAMIGFGVLGGMLNDSGVVIPALVLVYVGALLFLVQVRQPFSPAVVLNDRTPSEVGA